MGGPVFQEYTNNLMRIHFAEFVDNQIEAIRRARKHQINGPRREVVPAQCRRRIVWQAEPIAQSAA
jgi:hypothetical protein